MIKEKWYTEEDILAKFAKLTLAKKYKIISEALDMALSNRAGTKAYAICKCMGYRYEDDGTYTYVGHE